jgi:hypothetical protein
MATEVEVRELYYSHAGGFDSSRMVGGSEWRLTPLGLMWNDARAQPLEGAMAGFNTYVERPDDRVEGLATEFEDALRVCPAGTRLTVLTTCRGAEELLGRLDGEALPCPNTDGTGDTLQTRGLAAVCFGVRRGAVRESRVAFKCIRPYMD